MKKWIVTHTSDTETYLVDEVEGATYSKAYVKAMGEFPGDMITDLREA